MSEKEHTEKPSEVEEGWAPVAVQEEEKEAVAFEARRQAALDGAILVIPPLFKELINVLMSIKDEIKRTNDYVITGSSTAVQVTEMPPEVVERPVTEVEVPVIPTNLASEGDIEKTYKEHLSEVLEDSKLENVEISVEEDKVILRLPWLSNELWREVNELLRDVGGEYVSDGKNTHYVLPHP